MSPTLSTRRTAIWEWVHVTLLAAGLAWTTLCLGGYRPETMATTIWFNAALLASVCLGRACQSGSVAHPAGWLLLPFLFYAAVNAGWLTPVPWLGWHDWLLWAQMTAVFWAVLNGVRSPAARTALLVVLGAIGVVAVGLAAYQRFVRPDWLMLGRIQAAQFIGRASGPFGIPNSLAALLLLLLPSSLCLACGRGRGVWRRAGGGAVALVYGFGLVLTISRGAWLGLALALMVWPLLLGGRRWGWRLGVSAGVLVALLAAGAVLYEAVPGVRGRLEQLVKDRGELTRPIMWRMAWQIFREHPATGGGAGSYNILIEKMRPEKFQDDPQWAHNDYLNTLSDYGATGFILLFGAAAAIAWRCARGRSGETGPADRADVAMAVGLFAFALQLFVDFHFKIPALGMAFALLAALVVQRRWVPPPSPAPAAFRLASGVVAVAVLGLTAWWAWPHYRAEGLRYGARREIDAMALHPLAAAAERVLLQRARESFARATEIDATNAQAWSDRAYATSLWSRQDTSRNLEFGREGETEARRALALSALIPEFWLRLGTAQDMQGDWVGAGKSYGEALRLAPASASIWYYQAYHLSLRASSRLVAEAAVAICLRLDPSNREAEALRQRLKASP